ncbi:MAG: polysaccharide deacetylase family protein [Burkholderiaceae bacterium]
MNSNPRKQTRPAARCAVLHYGIENASTLANPQRTVFRFREQITALSRRGYSIIGQSQLVDAIEHGAPLPGRAVVLSFDAGCPGLFDRLVPVLDEHGLPATIFMRPQDCRDRAELASLADRGIEPGLQLRRVPRNRQASVATLIAEIEQDIVDVIKAFGVPVSHAACDFGETSANLRQAVRASGFLRSVSSTIPGRAWANCHVDPLTLRRVPVSPVDDVDRFVWRIWRGAVDSPARQPLAHAA